MERTDVLVDLQAYKADLAAELRRVDAALTALGVNGESVPDTPATIGTGTYDLLRAFTLRQPQFDAQSALCYLVDNGWQADKRGDALNTVRTALAHMASWGEVKRVRRGVYCVSAPQTRMNVPSLREQVAGTG